MKLVSKVMLILTLLMNNAMALSWHWKPFEDIERALKDIERGLRNTGKTVANIVTVGGYGYEIDKARAEVERRVSAEKARSAKQLAKLRLEHTVDLALEVRSTLHDYNMVSHMIEQISDNQLSIFLLISGEIRHRNKLAFKIKKATGLIDESDKTLDEFLNLYNANFNTNIEKDLTRIKAIDNIARSLVHSALHSNMSVKDYLSEAASNTELETLEKIAEISFELRNQVHSLSILQQTLSIGKRQRFDTLKETFDTYLAEYRDYNFDISFPTLR